MLYAENIVKAYRSRSRSEEWAAWVNENPVLAKMLMEAEILCQQ